MDSEASCICTPRQQYNRDLMRPFFIKAPFARIATHARQYTEITLSKADGVEMPSKSRQ